MTNDKNNIFKKANLVVVGLIVLWIFGGFFFNATIFSSYEPYVITYKSKCHDFGCKEVDYNYVSIYTQSYAEDSLRYDKCTKCDGHTSKYTQVDNYPAAFLMSGGICLIVLVLVMNKWYKQFAQKFTPETQMALEKNAAMQNMARYMLKRNMLSPEEVVGILSKEEIFDIVYNVDNKGMYNLDDFELVQKISKDIENNNNKEHKDNDNDISIAVDDEPIPNNGSLITKFKKEAIRKGEIKPKDNKE